MMAHMVFPEKVLEQVKLMESYGVNCIYCTESAGYMLTDEAAVNIGLVRAEPNADSELGGHGLSIWRLPTYLQRLMLVQTISIIGWLGCRCWSSPLEVFVAVLERMQASHGIDLYKILDVAEDLAVPLMDQPIRVDRDALTLGLPVFIAPSFCLLSAQKRNEASKHAIF